MKDFVEYLIKNIVAEPDAVEIKQIDGEKRTLIEVEVDAQDIGKVVGKNGRVIRSIRTLASSIGAKLGMRVDIVIVGAEAQKPAEAK